MRANDFRVLVPNASGELVETSAPTASTYRGEVIEEPTAKVSAVLRAGKLTASVVEADGSQWHIQPINELGGTAAASGLHVVYRDEDIIPIEAGCGHDNVSTSAVMRSLRRDLGGTGGTAGTGMKLCAIAFDTDFEFFQLNGSSVANTVNDIETVMNHVSLIYESQANLLYEITTIVVRNSAADPYSATNDDLLLEQFQDEWNLNMQGVHRDIAHLMTGKNLDGTVIGVAYNSSVCEVCGTAEGYGLSQSRFTTTMVSRVCLTAHELGHGWGATHCDSDPQCAIMCSGLGGCSGNCAQFEAGSLGVIVAGINGASCLSNLADPVQPPFCDHFDGTISASNWSYNAAAGTSAAAINPPSPPTTLVLNGCCTTCANAPDELRSNYILLGGFGSATFSYFSQHGGGAGTAGAELMIEYANTAGEWIEINRLTSTGLSQSTFTRWTHALPVDAFHDEFRIRFRVATSTNQPNWFIDDVSVLTLQANSPVLHVRADAPGGGTGSTWADAYNDLQDALDVAKCSSGFITQIWVAAGTYWPDRGTNDRSRTFQLLNNLEILGGFAGYETLAEQRNPELFTSTLSGDIGAGGSTSDNSFHVVTGSLTDATAALDGFTIADGNANSTGANNSGAGVLTVAGGPTIRNCNIRDNLGTSAAGMLNSSGSTTSVEDCLFQNNRATSVSGGAMSNTLGATVSITRCRFLGNKAQAAGGAIHNSTSLATVDDSIFVGNTGLSGATINNSGSTMILTHCTLAGNVAFSTAGGILSTSSSTELHNCILWGNQDFNGMIETSQLSGAATADYSCIQDNDPNDANVFAGAGNIDDAPLFVRSPSDGGDGWGVGSNDDYGDLRLTTPSPCVDAGDPTYVSVTNVDLDHHARVLCGVVDMGAFEAGVLDENCDSAIDLTDYLAWPVCFTGPNGGPYASGCEPFDVEADTDVDLLDWAGFMNGFGP